MNRGMIVTGSYKGASGHDHHTRSIVKALHSNGVDIELRDMPNWSPAKLPLALQDQWYDRLTAGVNAQAHLHFCMPHQARSTPGLRNINYTMFEADRIPNQWVQQALNQEIIVVPVQSCKQAFIASGVPEEKIEICPLGVDATTFTPDVSPLDLNREGERRPQNYRLRFLNVSEAIDRKNLLGLLKAWMVSTNKQDDAALLLKAGFHRPGSRTRFFMRLQELEKSMGKTLDESAPVFWVTATLPPSAVPSLYTAATHYISLSCGEGFDLSMVEAGVSGLQLIAPRHTAYLDYLNDDIAHLIPSREVQAQMCDDPETARLFEGAHWWQPNHEEACKLIRGIIDGRTEKKQRAREALSRLTWSATAERLEQIAFSAK